MESADCAEVTWRCTASAQRWALCLPIGKGDNKSVECTRWAIWLCNDLGVRRDSRHISPWCNLICHSRQVAPSHLMFYDSIHTLCVLPSWPPSFEPIPAYPTEPTLYWPRHAVGRIFVCMVNVLSLYIRGYLTGFFVSCRGWARRESFIVLFGMAYIICLLAVSGDALYIFKGSVRQVSLWFVFGVVLKYIPVVF